MRDSSCFFLQNFHLNQLNCRCRNTKRFSASLNNCLGKLVEIAITDQNAWAFGDERFESCVTLRLRDSRLHMVLVFARKGSQRWKRRSSIWAKRLSDGSDEVLCSLSSAVSYFGGYLYCKLNGKHVSDQRSKCCNAHERFPWSFCGCVDYSWIFNFDCCVFSFENNCARESKFL